MTKAGKEVQLYFFTADPTIYQHWLANYSSSPLPVFVQSAKLRVVFTISVAEKS